MKSFKIDRYKRYQKGLSMTSMFPKVEGFCACGCGRELPKRKRKWFSKNCSDKSYRKFAVIKGDIGVIRDELFKVDFGFCHMCGVESESWQADHIKPVHLGGGGCSLENFQTLCLDCHKEKTLSDLNRSKL